MLVTLFYLLLRESLCTAATTIVAHSEGERCSQMYSHTHWHLQVTIIIVGIIPGMIIIKGSFELPSCLGRMIWLAPNNELWEPACPALIFLPWHPLQGCQSGGQIKRPTTFFFLPLSLPPGDFLFSLSGGLPLISGDELKVKLPVDRSSYTALNDILCKGKRERQRLLFIHISLELEYTKSVFYFLTN